jgi:hypothetical protein
VDIIARPGARPELRPGRIPRPSHSSPGARASRRESPRNRWLYASGLRATRTGARGRGPTLRSSIACEPCSSPRLSARGANPLLAMVMPNGTWHEVGRRPRPLRLLLALGGTWPFGHFSTLSLTCGSHPRSGVSRGVARRPISVGVGSAVSVAARSAHRAADTVINATTPAFAVSIASTRGHTSSRGTRAAARGRSFEPGS